MTRDDDVREGGGGTDGPWCVEGRWNDSTPDHTIRANLSHYRVWLWPQVYRDGRLLFNDDFLGRWRYSPPPRRALPGPPPSAVENESTDTGDEG